MRAPVLRPPLPSPTSRLLDACAGANRILTANRSIHPLPQFPLSPSRIPPIAFRLLPTAHCPLPPLRALRVLRGETLCGPKPAPRLFAHTQPATTSAPDSFAPFAFSRFRVSPRSAPSVNRTHPRPQHLTRISPTRTLLPTGRLNAHHHRRAHRPPSHAPDHPNVYPPPGGLNTRPPDHPNTQTI